MSKPSFFEQEDFDDSKLKSALKEAEERNGKKKTFASEDALALLGQEFNFKKEKKEMVDNLNWLKSLTVEEFTFRKKWEEIQENRQYLSECGVVKAQIWTPTDLNDEKKTIEEISKLQPRIELVKTKYQQKLWDGYRIYSHSAEYNQAPGRLCRYLVFDETTGKVIGFSSIASEVISISCRDEVIGWEKEKRVSSGVLKNSAICQTIAATQPFGCNFLGGKLIAALVTSSATRDSWKSEYDSRLVGLTTTSLYGPYSMYNSLKWWKPVGVSKGKISLKPTEETYRKWHAWIKKNRTEEYYKMITPKEGQSGPVTSSKLRILAMIFNSTGIKQSDYVHGYERGVYYSFFYENSKEFLRGEIGEDKLVMKPLFAGDFSTIMEWWKPKAIERYKKLKAENRLNPEKLFYSPMCGMTYEEAKAKYFHDVGR